MEAEVKQLLKISIYDGKKGLYIIELDVHSCSLFKALHNHQPNFPQYHEPLGISDYEPFHPCFSFRKSGKD